MTDTTPRYYTVKEMAAILKVSTDTIYAAIDRGELPALRMGRGKGGAIRVRKDAFEKWLEQNEKPSHG
jgi:excisionase family DNA binding protein